MPSGANAGFERTSTKLDAHKHKHMQANHKKNYFRQAAQAPKAIDQWQVCLWIQNCWKPQWKKIFVLRK